MDENIAIQQPKNKGRLKTLLWIVVVVILLMAIYFLWNPFAPNVYGEGLKVVVP